MTRPYVDVVGTTAGGFVENTRYSTSRRAPSGMVLVVFVVVFLLGFIFWSRIWPGPTTPQPPAVTTAPYGAP